MRLVALIALLVAASVPGLGQSTDDFSGANHVVANDRYDWVSPTGTAAGSTGSIEIVGDGTATPYHASGPTNTGYVVWDSLLQAPFEAWVIYNQKSGTDNVRQFVIGVATSKVWTSPVGYFGGLQEMTSSGGVDRFTIKRMDWGMSTTGGASITEFATTPRIDKEFSVGDTFGVTVQADNRITFWISPIAGGGRNSSNGNGGGTVSFIGSQHSLTGGAYVFIGGAEQTTPFKVSAFGIASASAPAAPPSSTDDVKPSASFVVSNANPFTGDAINLTVTASDDSALNTSTVQFDTGTGIKTGTVNTYAGTQTSGGFTSGNLVRYTAGTMLVRVITTDHNKYDAAIRRDTTAWTTVTYTVRPAVSRSSSVVFGWLTFTDTKWPAPYVGGTIPHDSIPWEVMTHASLFAANGANPPQSSYIAQYPYLFARAHQSGVDAGICVGGSGDAALVTLMGTVNRTTWASWISTYMGYLDNGKGDFIDFDLEGTYTVANVATFLQQVKDSLNLRTSGNNPSRAPYIVLTVSASRARAWALSQPSLTTICEMVVMMTYDYMTASTTTWGRLVPDNAVKSRQFWNGTGTITDNYPPIGSTNAEAPTMQKFAGWAAEGGWAANQIVVGFDVMPGYYASTNTTVGARGPLYIRQPIPLPDAGLTSNSAAPTMASLWTTMRAIPNDSIFFDQTGQFYWAHTGGAAAGGAATTDRVYSFMAMPGRDSAVRAARKISDSMNIAGVAFWNLGFESGYNVSTPPAEGRGWFFNQIRTAFGGSGDTIISSLNPPTTFVPANGATGVSISVTFDWSDVSGVNASHGYGFQISTSSAFTTSVKDTTVTPSSISLTGYLTNGTVYYARVRVKNSSNVWGNWSAPVGFTTIVAIPGAPTLLFPTNGATDQAALLTLSWQAVPNAATYSVQVDSVSTGFSNLVINQTGITSTSININVQTGKTFYWRVRAVNAAGAGSYSSTRTFTTSVSKPGQAILSEPPNGLGSQDTNALKLVWGAGQGGVTYRLQISTVSSFASKVVDTLTSALEKLVWGLTGNTTYYWRVNVYNATDSSGYTTPWTFTTTVASLGLLPRLGGQFPYVHDQAIGTVNVGQPPRYFGMRRGYSDMRDVPKPPDETYDYWSLDGIVQNIGGDKTTIPRTSGGDASSGAPDGDTVANMRLINPFVEGSILVEDKYIADTTRTSGVRFLPNTTQPGEVVLVGVRSGNVATEDGAVLTPYSVEPDVAVSQPGGGFGITPVQAQALGYPLSILVFNPAIFPPAWSWISYADLQSLLKLISFNGITGPKFPYVASDGSIKYMDSATVAGGSGSAPTGRQIIDSLNSTTGNQFRDTLTRSFTFMNDSLIFLDVGNIMGRLYPSTTYLVLEGGVTGNDGVMIYDPNGGTSLRMSAATADNGVLIQTFAGTAGRHVTIQNRWSSTIENDSLFQLQDSSASGTGKRVYRVSSKGTPSLHASYAQGSAAFTTTATTCTVTVTGASTTDSYQITLTGSAAPSANDAYILQKTSTGFVLHRSASGTSGLTFDWWRAKVIP